MFKARNILILLFLLAICISTLFIFNFNKSEKEAVPGTDHIPIDNENDPKEINEELSLSEKITSMSLDEKIGQMIFAGITGTSVNSETRNLILEHKVGGIILFSENMTNVNQSVVLINEIKKLNENNHFPLFLGIDQEGGRITRLPGGLMDLPTNLDIGKLDNPHLSYEIGQLLAKQVDAFGFNMNFAPVLDINSNPNNPVIGDRSFGNQADIVSELGVETMKGIQSGNIISVIKHFPGHGDTTVDSHLELPVVSKTLDELSELELLPFKEAIQQGADVVMIAHILLPEIDANYPSSMSKPVITDLLRQTLNYNGVVITDDLTMKAIMNNYSIGQAAVQSIKAGSDIVMVAHDYKNVESVIKELRSAVLNGDISEDQINMSVERILLLKQKYKINDNRIESVNIEALNESIESILKQFQ